MHDILDRASAALSPAVSCWHINNPINLICYWVLGDRLLAPAEQKAVPKGERGEVTSTVDEQEKKAS